jgi:hypothetical protein
MSLDKDITSGIRSSSRNDYSLGGLTMSGNGRREAITEQELRQICRTSAAMFIDEIGYTAAVLLGVQRALGSRAPISMDGGNEARLSRWRGDLWRLFEDTNVDVLGVLYEELMEARRRQKSDADHTFHPETDSFARAAGSDGNKIRGKGYRNRDTNPRDQNG